jgi:hypothetical protein
MHRFFFSWVFFGMANAHFIDVFRAFFPECLGDTWHGQNSSQRIGSGSTS